MVLEETAPFSNATSDDHESAHERLHDPNIQKVHHSSWPWKSSHGGDYPNAKIMEVLGFVPKH